LSQGLSNRGANQIFTGEFEQADASLSESLALARAAGPPFTTCLVLNQLGTLARLRGQFIGRALIQLGRALSEQGELTAAMGVFRDALSGGEASLMGPTLGQLLNWTAAIFSATGEPLRAARLFGAADSIWRASGTTPYPFDDVA
jgi:hypothetical protein